MYCYNLLFIKTSKLIKLDFYDTTRKITSLISHHPPTLTFPLKRRHELGEQRKYMNNIVYCFSPLQLLKAFPHILSFDPLNISQNTVKIQPGKRYRGIK